MWKIALVCAVALSFGGTNGAFFDNEELPQDIVQNNVGPPSILLKALEPRDTSDANDLMVEEQIALLNVFLGRSAVANTIKNMLESFRDTVINGSDDFPILDPLVIDHIGPFVYTHTGVRISANINNFRMEGLRWYLVNDVTFNALRLAIGVRMTLPWIVLTGTYDATAWITFVSHRAGGNYRIFLNRLDVDVDARLGTNILGGHLMLRTLDIRINVNDLQINIGGMTGSPVLNNLINGIVQSVTREFINNEMENVSKLISEAVFEIINDILRDFTLEDLLS